MGSSSTADVEVRPLGSAPTGLRRRLDAASWAFLGLLVASVPLILVAARDRWFWVDEWEVLLHRDAGDAGSLLRPWWGHAIVVPTVVFKLLQRAFGLGDYRPFLLVGLAGHLASTTMVWLLTRRVGVRGWLATATVAPLLVLGSGRTNIVFAFQMTMTFSLALGLAHLALAHRQVADATGTWTRRDTAGVLCTLVALLFSAVALAVLVGVGVAVLLQRGARLAVLHTVPILLAWLTWTAVAPSEQPSTVSIGSGSVGFAGEVVAATFDGIGQHPVVALGVAVLFLVGLVPALAGIRAVPKPPRQVLAVALASSAAAFSGLVVVQRVEHGFESRYVHVLVSLILAVVALGIERCWRRRPALGVVGLALVLVGVPGNVALLDDLPDGHRIFAAAFRSDYLDLAADDHLIFWLDAKTARDLRDRGDTPPARTAPTPEEQLTADGLVAVAAQLVEDVPDCDEVSRATRAIGPDDVVVVRGDIDVVLIDGDTRSRPLRFRTIEGARAMSAVVPMVAELAGVDGGVVFDC